MTVDLFELIAAQDSLGLTPSLTVIIEVAYRRYSNTASPGSQMGSS
jgi:hypothetical protein